MPLLFYRLEQNQLKNNELQIHHLEMKRTIFPQDFSQYYPIGIQPCRMYVDVAHFLKDVAFLLFTR